MVLASWRNNFLSIGLISFNEWKQEEQIISAEGTSQEGLKEFADSKDPNRGPESLTDVRQGPETTNDCDRTIPKLSRRPNGYIESGNTEIMPPM